MKKISILIKPASSLCNLRCKYCFYTNISSIREVKSYGNMKLQLVDELIPSVYSILDDGDELSIAFQGGEPTLAGLRYFEYFVGKINEQKKRINIHYSIQTNGTVINNRWCKFLKSNNFLVGLSLDGYPLYHDLNRVDLHGRGTFYKVIKTKELFDEYEIPYNILCVLTNPLAKHAKKVFNFMKENNVKYIQFIPCLDDLNADKRSSFALTPERFASFYRSYFDFWLKQLRQGTYQSVKLIDDVINLFTYGKVNACGLTGKCGVQFIIEADGSVYPCDFYALDEYRLGYIQNENLKELFSKPVSEKFIHSRKSLPAFCNECPFRKICCGGCKRMGDAMYVSSTNDFCGYQEFLKIVLPHKQEILDLLSNVEAS